LKERGYADESDMDELEEFMTAQLGNRPAFLRPGLRFKARWRADDAADARARVVREDVNAILAAAREPLPAAAR
jgi:hypothetical protein